MPPAGAPRRSPPWCAEDAWMGGGADHESCNFCHGSHVSSPPFTICPRRTPHPRGRPKRSHCNEIRRLARPVPDLSPVLHSTRHGAPDSDPARYRRRLGPSGIWLYPSRTASPHPTRDPPLSLPYGRWNRRGDHSRRADVSIDGSVRSCARLLQPRLPFTRTESCTC